MSLVSMRQLLDHAAEFGYGLPAFNVNNLEQVQAIMEAAAETDSPVIMQASAGARKYAGEAFLRHLIDAAVEAYPHIPVVMHQDHGQSPAICMGAIRSGFSSVMMDGSLMEDGKTPSSYEYNVDVTRRVVEMSHAIGVSVEGELGCLGSLETGQAGEEDGVGAEGTLDHAQMLTDPDQAADFVKQTNVDALAIAIGTSHGAYKFTRKPTGDILAIERIKEINARIPNTHLVMHGSSSVPQELLEIIREYGGDMKETYGVPVEEIVRGIKYGVRKINIDTDIRLAMTGAIRKFFVENPSKFDPREFLKPAREAAKLVCKARFEAFGTAGNASKIKPINLDKIAAAYKSGALNQIVR
ncbi:fructose-1,6-bisphosphate aldolase [Zoogloea ramigera]|jgi:fructose-bisphosphate aldolase class II|uniref:Fructose-1,6-bisphosphate aldolase n=1 Tax=Zoogloea ramigera TaxID=350 RepID=A0A4Y4D370_ZOORA|nr:class II fructose-bisphosphate aldolase [Zoogloea ramigera]MBP6800224.1 fructose-bisphosphate aldolase class II [Zoogloea sp.]MBP7625915.1 fructose-bisphosphate aldolase class II [Zoogloea sp.]GEC97717.1 fructose-1,6-bisphosphate aldolase [Zoogloea ramigera]